MACASATPGLWFWARGMRVSTTCVDGPALAQAESPNERISAQRPTERALGLCALDGFSILDVMDLDAPSFLIAMPDLVDPNFARAVVLLCAHSEDGAFGVVTNRPLSISVKAVCEEANIPWIGDEVTPIYYGGPVEPQRGWVLHDTSSNYEGSQEIGEGISITASHDGLVAYGASPLEDYRLILGYAGWGPGQLDRELLEGSWLQAPLTRNIVFGTDPEDAWQAALRSVGVNPLHLVSGGSGIH